LRYVLKIRDGLDSQLLPQMGVELSSSTQRADVRIDLGPASLGRGRAHDRLSRALGPFPQLAYYLLQSPSYVQDWPPVEGLAFRGSVADALVGQHRWAPLAERLQASGERRMRCQAGFGVGRHDDRQFESDRFVQDAEGEGVADSGRPLVDRVECRR